MSEINEYLKEAEIAVLAPAPNMLADTLTKVLADTVVFYFKAHSFHWNVTGSNFPQYHEFLGNVYEQVYGNVDRLAEEIRAEARHLEAPLLAEDPPREPPASSRTADRSRRDTWVPTSPTTRPWFGRESPWLSPRTPIAW